MNKSSTLKVKIMTKIIKLSSTKPIKLEQTNKKVLDKALLFDFDGVLVDSFEISFTTSQITNKNWKNRKSYRELFNGNVYDGLKTAKARKINNFFDIYGPKLMRLGLTKNGRRCFKATIKKL